MTFPHSVTPFDIKPKCARPRLASYLIQRHCAACHQIDFILLRLNPIVGLQWLLPTPCLVFVGDTFEEMRARASRLRAAYLPHHMKGRNASPLLETSTSSERGPVLAKLKNNFSAFSHSALRSKLQLPTVAH